MRAARHPALVLTSRASLWTLTLMCVLAGSTASARPELVRATVKPSATDAVVRFRTTPKGHLQVRITKRIIHLEEVRSGRATPLAAHVGYRRPRRGSVDVRIVSFDRSVFVQVADAKRKRALASLSVARAPEGRPSPRLTGPGELLNTSRPCSRPLPGPNPRVWFTADRAAKGFKEIDRHHARTVYSAKLRQVWTAACSGTNVRGVTASPPWAWKDGTYARARRARRWREPWTDISLAVKHPTSVEALLHAWHDALPEHTRLEAIGKSHRGRTIWALAISTGPQDTWPAKRSVLLNGAHHGNEPMSVDFVLDATHRLLDGVRSGSPWVKDALSHTVVWVVPVVNPDGLHGFLEVSSHIGRKNGRPHGPMKAPDRIDGVDLNRNYPFKWGALGNKGSRKWKSSVYYRGASAASEPEVQAMLALADRERFDWSLTYHTGTVALLYCYTIDGTPNPAPNPNEVAAKALIAELPDHPHNKPWRIRSNLYPVDGTDQDWHWHTHGTLALLVEGARSTPRTAKARRELLDSVWPIAERLLKSSTMPPRLELEFVGSDGPVSDVEVTVDGLTVAGERWAPRARDGRLNVWLGRPGLTTVRVNRGDSVLLTAKINVPASGTRTRIRVDDASATRVPEGP